MLAESVVGSWQMHIYEHRCVAHLYCRFPDRQLTAAYRKSACQTGAGMFNNIYNDGNKNFNLPPRFNFLNKQVPPKGNTILQI